MLVFLRQLENAFLGSPVLRGFEFEEGAFGVSCVEGDRLSLLHVETGHPHIIVYWGKVHRGEIFHDLQGDEPGIHQKSSGFIDPKNGNYMKAVIYLQILNVLSVLDDISN